MTEYFGPQRSRSGYCNIDIDTTENELLNRVMMDSFLELLTPKEKDTIVLWSKGYTLKEIALIISRDYDEKSISARGMCPRIRKILNKLREHV